MKKPINVLSIDWDYFINATEEQRITQFPDPNDNLGTKLNNFIWANRYAQNPKIHDIGVTTSEFDELKYYLTKVRQNPKSVDTKVMITNSHKFIYDFVVENLTDSTPVRMFHIDYHTDCYGMNFTSYPKEELNCGNWVNYLCEHLKGRPLKFSNISWLGRLDSERDPDLPKVVKRVEYDPTMNDLADMLSHYFGGSIPDLIFLCKSNPWSPPHLDYKFDELSSILMKTGRVRYSNDIENRFTEEFKNTIADVRKSVEESINKYRKEENNE